MSTEHTEAKKPYSDLSQDERLQHLKEMIEHNMELIEQLAQQKGYEELKLDTIAKLREQHPVL
jgi:hypothetical protein